MFFNALELREFNSFGVLTHIK